MPKARLQTGAQTLPKHPLAGNSKSDDPLFALIAKHNKFRAKLRALCKKHPENDEIINDMLPFEDAIFEEIFNYKPATLEGFIAYAKHVANEPQFNEFPPGISAVGALKNIANWLGEFRAANRSVRHRDYSGGKRAPALSISEDIRALRA